jgi:hypothetical protein
MRGLVLLESLVGGGLPLPMQAVVVRQYPHLLGGDIPVNIAELMVSRDKALAVAMQLARALLPSRFYAHLLDEETMYVVFPDCLAVVSVNSPESAQAARRIGALYGIPAKQMRFIEMFHTDHPDSPVAAREAS